MHILLVEDHTDTRVVLSRLLVQIGYQVSSAGNVQDALTLLSGVWFDVLLSDINLPDGDGFDVLAEAKKRQPLKRAVALTALASEEDRAHGLRAGFDEYLTKPLDVPRLLAVLSAA